MLHIDSSVLKRAEESEEPVTDVAPVPVDDFGWRRRAHSSTDRRPKV